jgi:hypothetical protein
MSRQERVEALEATITRLADTQGRSYEEALAELEKIALIQKFRNVQALNRAEAEAKGYRLSDVQKWVEEDRKSNRGL